MKYVKGISGAAILVFFCFVFAVIFYILSIIDIDNSENIQRIVQSTTMLALAACVAFGLLIGYMMYKDRKAKNALLTANCELDTVTSSIPGGVLKCMLENDGCTLAYMSEGFLQLTGYIKSEIYDLFGNSFFNIIYPQDRTRVRDTISRQLKNGNTIEVTYRLVIKNGDVLWVLTKGERSLDKTGKPCLYSVVVNITEQIEARFQLETITNNVNGGIAITELDDEFTVTYMNEGHLRMMGYTKEQFRDELDNKAFRLLIPEEKEAIASSIRDQLQTRNRVSYEFRLRKRSGDIIWVLAQGQMIMDLAGHSQFCCIVVDITKSKATEQELRISEARYKIALNQLDYIIFDYDTHQKTIRIANETTLFCDFSGEISNVPESLVEDGIVHPETADQCTHMFRDILEGKSSSSCSAQLRGADGQYRWCKITLTNIFDDNKCAIRAVGVIEDITVQKETEQRFVKEHQYREAILSSAIQIYKINFTKDRFVKGHENWENQFGIIPTTCYSEMITAIAKKGIHTDDAERFLSVYALEHVLEAYRDGKTEVSLEYRRMHLNGYIMWVQCTLHLLRDPYSHDIKGIAYIKDINDQKTKELDMQYRAERDSLSSLYNKGATEQLITDFLSSDEGKQNQHALLILDIDDFKAINDTHGHVQGDEVLVNVADSIQVIFRSTDILGRVGGDEFILFLKNISKPEAAVRKAKELNVAMKSLYIDNDPSYPLSASVGIALYPCSGTTFDELYRNADSALYEAKNNGKNNYALYK